MVLVEVNMSKAVAARVDSMGGTPTSAVSPSSDPPVVYSTSSPIVLGRSAAKEEVSSDTANDGGADKHRLDASLSAVFGRFLPHQLATLENFFCSVSCRPTNAEIDSLFVEIGKEGKGKLSVNMVKRWFEERRAMERSAERVGLASPSAASASLLKEQLAILEHYYQTVTMEPMEDDLECLSRQLNSCWMSAADIDIIIIDEWFRQRRERGDDLDFEMLEIEEKMLSALPASEIHVTLHQNERFGPSVSPVSPTEERKDHFKGKGKEKEKRSKKRSSLLLSDDGNTSQKGKRKRGHRKSLGIVQEEGVMSRDEAAWKDIAETMKMEAVVSGRFLPWQLAILDNYYCNVNSQPSNQEVQILLQELGPEGKGPLSVNMVKKWFRDRVAAAHTLDGGKSPTVRRGLITSSSEGDDINNIIATDSEIVAVSPAGDVLKETATVGRFLPHQQDILEQYFLNVSGHPSATAVQALYEEIGPEGNGPLSVNMVRQWFVTRRQSEAHRKGRQLPRLEYGTGKGKTRGFSPPLGGDDIKKEGKKKQAKGMTVRKSKSRSGGVSPVTFNTSPLPDNRSPSPKFSALFRFKSPRRSKDVLRRRAMSPKPRRRRLRSGDGGNGSSAGEDEGTSCQPRDKDDRGNPTSFDLLPEDVQIIVKKAQIPVAELSDPANMGVLCNVLRFLKITREVGFTQSRTWEFDADVEVDEDEWDDLFPEMPEGLVKNMEGVGSGSYGVVLRGVVNLEIAVECAPDMKNFGRVTVKKMNLQGRYPNDRVSISRSISP